MINTGRKYKIVKDKMKEKRRGIEKKDNPIKRKWRGQVDDYEGQE